MAPEFSWLAAGAEACSKDLKLHWHIQPTARAYFILLMQHDSAGQQSTSAVRVQSAAESIRTRLWEVYPRVLKGLEVARQRKQSGW